MMGFDVGSGVGTGLGTFASTGNPWAALAGLGLGGLFGGGSAKQADKLLEAQVQLATMLANLQRQQAAIDLPFRKNLFSALQGRLGKQMPVFTPPKMPAPNPYTHLMRARFGPQVPGQGGTGLRPTLLAAALKNRMPQYVGSNAG